MEENNKVNNERKKRKDLKRLYAGLLAAISIGNTSASALADFDDNEQSKDRVTSSVEDTMDISDRNNGIYNVSSVTFADSLSTSNDGILGRNITVSQEIIDSYRQYVKDIEVSYPYSEYFYVKDALNKYNSLDTYNSNASNLFVNGKINSDQLYEIVFNNNKAEDYLNSKTLSKSELKDICEVICNIINGYVSNNKDADLKMLSEKISKLKIVNYNEFSNGYYDSVSGTMGFDVNKLKKSDVENFFESTIQHEVYHLIQANSIEEIAGSSLESRYGPAYKFTDLTVNTLNWIWFYEGSAEYLNLDYNGSKDTTTYQNLIRVFDTVKTATIINPDNEVTGFEELSLSSSLDSFFKYFGCKTEEDKEEIINMMFAYEIILDLNYLSPLEDFYQVYKEKYGEAMSSSEKTCFVRQLKGSCAQTLTKNFYSNLASYLSNSVKLQDIFSMISIFENELSRELWYSTSTFQDDYQEFFTIYNDIQSVFFQLVADELGISIEDVQEMYNTFNADTKVDANTIEILDKDKQEYYSYILETRKSDKKDTIYNTSLLYQQNKNTL